MPDFCPAEPSKGPNLGEDFLHEARASTNINIGRRAVAVDELHSVILQQLQELNEHARATGERIAALESSLKFLVGNGQPGRIQQIETRITASEEDVKNLQHWQWRIGGIATAIAVAVPYLIRFLLTGKP